MPTIEIDRARVHVRERHDSRVVGVAEKGGPLFGCLAVTRFALRKQSADRRRYLGLEVMTAKQRRAIRIGGLTSGEHPDKVRSEPAGCSALCSSTQSKRYASRVSLLCFFFFLASRENDRRTSLCSKKRRLKGSREMRRQMRAFSIVIRLFILLIDEIFLIVIFYKVN